MFPDTTGRSIAEDSHTYATLKCMAALRFIVVVIAVDCFKLKSFDKDGNAVE
jgi:hypothetical protein